MDLLIPPADQAWQERAKNFAETILFPQELELELNGPLSRETKDNLRAEVIKHGFAGINHSTEVGGKGCTQFQQTLINEELGKATGALWAAVWHPAVPLKHGTKKQIEEYHRPSCEGKRRACVAITEPDVCKCVEFAYLTCTLQRRLPSSTIKSYLQSIDGRFGINPSSIA